jgi:anti-sigma B factor antagonist
VTRRSDTVKGTSTRGPASWKITEVADLRGDRTLVVHGELDIATAPELVAMLDRLRRQGHPVTLDLAEVTFMDSTGLTTLMDAHVQSTLDGWTFNVRRMSPAVKRVFALAGVDDLLSE